ncbi:hydantoinase/oxoprolinase family protein [Desulfosporosinus shakirovi]|uniref:hydantoinase/oxoprolinase family protein n=1 Tax=Desulfosporosinus shakirovi TaxID=2885154 RepID=UPI001E47A2E2|nr:hydantoinase/oxoprolinase family protein [Desulfosporosinus sp. SRJS8]MCB8815100.1 hydantoinase/oxoprolinase family protein [Desulfosporosinus sp. SRJS8]
MFEISVDVGGTFADFIVRDRQGATFTAKVPSSHENPLEPIIRGLTELAKRFDLSLEEFLELTDKFIHGTTVGINALLQGQGAKTALITTEGFRDALELRRSRLAEQWDFRVALSPVLVPRHLRIGLRERMDYLGMSIKAADRAQIKEIAGFLRQEGVESVAVCLLFACRNPEHELMFKEDLQAFSPEVFVTLSSELSSQLGEYERTTTTVLNARLSPVLSNYLQDLRSHLRDKGLQVPILIAQNNGGLTDLLQASKRAVHTLFSGPAGGVKGGWALAREQEFSELVVGDMGGTSFDVSLIRQGKMEVTPQAEIAGYPVQLPMLDIHTVGAGGGSIAWLDKGGMLRVGPHSAGANPGPACYGLGGQEPTITDAALIMGLLDGSDFLGGRMSLDKELACEAVEKKVAHPLGLSVSEAAYAIYQVALSLMSDAVYLMTVKKGYDPRSFVLAAVGGALPLFATALAERVGIQQVVVPELAPVFCAQGLHHARFQLEVLRSLYEVLGEVPILSWNQGILELQSQADQELSRLGVSADQRDYVWSADLKYSDQHHEINVAILGDATDQEVWQQLDKGFHEAHQRLYGYSQPEKSLMLVNLRLLAQEKERSLQSRLSLRAGWGNTKDLQIYEKSTTLSKTNEVHSVYLQGAFQDVKIFRWQDLGMGMRLQGPAIIIKEYTTILIDENWQAELDQVRNLIIEIGKDGR